MKKYCAAAVAVSVLTSCSATLVSQKMQRFRAMQDIKMAAWEEALADSRTYCLQAVTPPECAMRLIKLSASLGQPDADWTALLLPPYLQVVEKYETKLVSKAGTLYPVDRRFMDELKVAATLVDQGVLTQEQMKRLVVSALQNLGDNLMKEYQGLEYQYQVALVSDAQIASALAAGITTGLVVGAVAASAPRSYGTYGYTSRSFIVSAGGQSYTCISTPTLLSCL